MYFIFGTVHVLEPALCSPDTLVRQSRIVGSEIIRLLLSEEHGVRTTSDAIPLAKFKYR